MDAESALKQVLPTEIARAAGLERVAEAVGIPAEKFDGIVREHQRRIYWLLAGLVRDADAAATLTQDCFQRAYQKRESFRGEASVGTWLARIAINLARDHGRNRRHAFWSRVMGGRKHESAPDGESEFGGARELARLSDGQASPERALAAREDVAAVWEAVDGLAAQQREAFLMRFGEEMTLDEIAEVMELEVGTVKSHLHRAVAAVRARLKAKVGT